MYTDTRITRKDANSSQSCPFQSIYTIVSVKITRLDLMDDTSCCINCQITVLIFVIKKNQCNVTVTTKLKPNRKCNKIYQCLSTFYRSALTYNTLQMLNIYVKLSNSNITDRSWLVHVPKYCLFQRRKRKRFLVTVKILITGFTLPIHSLQSETKGSV